MKFKNQEEFFKEVGDHYIKPMLFGESLHPITVEEMYQHFKARMQEETRIIPRPSRNKP